MRAASALLLAFASACSDCTETKNTTDAAPAPSASAPAGDAATVASDAQSDAPAAAIAPIDELPDGGMSELATRARHLLEAISQDNASLAGDIVLPREAYLTARDAQDPGGTYDARFKPGFEAQLHHVHRRDKGIEQAVFVAFELGPNPARVIPKKKEWREPLWRATRSTLTFTIDGRVHRLEIAEMIAWKGAWYVAKIH